MVQNETKCLTEQQSNLFPIDFCFDSLNFYIIQSLKHPNMISYHTWTANKMTSPRPIKENLIFFLIYIPFEILENNLVKEIIFLSYDITKYMKKTSLEFIFMHLVILYLSIHQIKTEIHVASRMDK